MYRLAMWFPAIGNPEWTWGSVKRFELYGSMDPNLGGSWDSWIPLGKYECVKPSPGADITPEDIAFAKAGINFDVTENTFASAPFPSGIYGSNIWKHLTQQNR